MARQRIYLNPRGANTLIYDTNSSDNYLKDIVVKRAAGQISSLSFTVENGGTLPEPMDEINVKVADGGDKEVFWGRVISIQKNMYNEYEVVCEGISARLNDVYLAEIKFRKKHTWTENGTPKVNTDGISTNNQTTWICGATVGRQIELLSSMVNAQLTELPISMWATSPVDSKPGVHLDFENADALTILSTIASAVDGSLYLENVALVVPNDYNAGTLTQQIAYGNNLVDFKDLFNFAPIATAVIPFGAYWNDSSYGAAGTVGDDWHRIGLEDLYGKSGYSDVKRIAIPRTYENMGQQKYYYYIQDDTKVAQYGKIFTSQIWDNIGTYGDLYTQAKAYLNSVNATQTITVNAIDLTGSAKFEPYYIVKFVNGQGSEISLRIVSQEIHIGEPEKDTVTLGDTATTITRGAGSAVTNAMMQEITNTVRANVIEQNNVQITNEFKQEIAQYNFSRDAGSNITVDALFNVLRGHAGQTGSVNLAKKDSGVGSSIPAGWYNYFFAPHRTGSGGDNPYYGTTILTPMNFSGNSWILRGLYYSSTNTGYIGEVKKIFDNTNSVGTFSGEQHSDFPNNQADLITRSFMSYWNGAYNSSKSSNLKYCANGDIIGSKTIGSQSVNYANTAGSATDSTKLPLSGGTMTGPIIQPTAGIPFISNHANYTTDIAANNLHWYSIGYSRTMSDESTPWWPNFALCLNNYWGIDIRTRGKESLRHNGETIAVKSDIPAKTSQLTNDSGYTTNTGTVTSVAVKMNGATKGTVTSSGTIDLGTVITDVSGKVDKVSGKGLSTNDYTTTEKNKLSGIASGAEVNVQSDWNVTDTTSDAYIKNKPTIITNNDLFYKAGDTVTYNGAINIQGCITQSSTYIYLTIITPKRIPSGLTATFTMANAQIRSNQQYLHSNSAFNIYSDGSTSGIVFATCAIQQENTIRIRLEKSATDKAFKVGNTTTTATNNVPIDVFGTPTITFS